AQHEIEANMLSDDDSDYSDSESDSDIEDGKDQRRLVGRSLTIPIFVFNCLEQSLAGVLSKDPSWSVFLDRLEDFRGQDTMELEGESVLMSLHRQISRQPEQWSHRQAAEVGNFKDYGIVGAIFSFVMNLILVDVDFSFTFFSDRFLCKE